MTRIADQQLPSAVDEAAAMWCVRLSEGGLSSAEQAEFDLWHADKSNSDALERAVAVWGAAGKIAEWPELVALRAEARAALARGGDRGHVAPPPRRVWRWASAIAASLIIAGLSGTLLLSQWDETIETGVGQHQVATLTDGSRVTLDASTTLEVKLGDDKREIQLEQGRAKFDVAKDSLRPFVVVAGDKLIVAIGTSFSVELVNGRLEVQLFEGQVEVRDRHIRSAAGNVQALPRTMSAGEELDSIVGQQDPGEISRPDLSQSLSWEQGSLIFDEELLPVAVERMNRYSSQKIVVADSSLMRMPVSGIFKGGDTGAFVEGLTTLHPVRAVRRGDEVVLTKK